VFQRERKMIYVFVRVCARAPLCVCE